MKTLVILQRKLLKASRAARNTNYAPAIDAVLQAINETINEVSEK